MASGAKGGDHLVGTYPLTRYGYAGRRWSLNDLYYYYSFVVESKIDTLMVLSKLPLRIIRKNDITVRC